MSRVEVQKIKIHDFKRIKSFEIELSPITALVGGNTSGKSSALQATQICVSLLQASLYRYKPDGKPEFLYTLSNEAVPYRPTDNLLSLCHGQPATQQSGFSIGFECLIENIDDEDIISEFTLKIARGKNANLSLKHDGDIELAGIIANPEITFSILTPGLSGIPHKEEWRTPGAIRSAVMHGDANLYLRTVLDHLLHQDLDNSDIDKWWNNEGEMSELPVGSSWLTFSKLLDRCYPGARVFVSHIPDNDRYVDVTVTYNDTWVTLDMASTGMLQVIQIIAYACLYRPPLLLLDEPDAHLHADSQSRLYDALRYLSQETKTRILFASHSPQLIQKLMYDSDASIIWMSNGDIVELDDQKRPAVPLLMELGALSVGTEIFDASKKVIFLTEDRNTEPVLAIAIANGADNNVAYLSYNGCGNLSGARQLARLLTDIRPELKVVIHRDRDFRTDSEVLFERENFLAWCASEKTDRIFQLFTSMNDTENSIATVGHLSLVFDQQISAQKLNSIIEDVMAEHRDEFTGLMRNARNAIKNSIYTSDRLRKKESWKHCGMPDKPPPDATFLPKSGKDPLTVKQCHGKTLLKYVIEKLHKEIGGSTEDIISIALSASTALEIAEWAKVLRSSN